MKYSSSKKVSQIGVHEESTDYYLADVEVFRYRTKERVKNEPGLKVPEAYDIESEVSKDPIDHLGLDTQKFVHQLSMISNGHYMT